MPITEPSGTAVWSPKIRDQSVVRKFISQNGRGYTAISIHDGLPGPTSATGSGHVDPDPNTIALQVWFQDVSDEFSTAPGNRVVNVDHTVITREDVGMYHYELGPPLTANRGILTIQWTYQIAGKAFVYNDFAQITEQLNFYDSLNAQEQLIVQQVTWMFGDLFDSTEGGPQLIEPFQTHYTYERLAQMEALAVTRFNLMSTFSNKPSTYGVGPGTQSLPAQFSGLMVFGTYLEVLRHLIRSYVEIPDFPGTDVTYTNRRDYFDRWNSIFTEEWPDYQKMVRNAKIGLLNMARGSLLVGGGIYGSSGAGGLFIAGGYAAMTRSFRFYPAAPAIGFGANLAIYRGPAG